MIKNKPVSRTVYLASLATEIDTLYNDSPVPTKKMAVWRICMRETRGDPSAARHLEQCIQNHRARKRKKAKLEKDKKNPPKHSSKQQNWQTQMEKLLSMPFILIERDAAAHELAMSPHVNDD
jgi:hypothetical protein